MKISLVNPPQTHPLNWEVAPDIFQPIGLAYIASILEQEGHKVNVIDANAEALTIRIMDGKYHSGLSMNETIDRIAQSKPDVVGISIPFSINEKTALNLARLVKDSISRDIKIVFGGAGASVRPVELLKSGFVDFVVVGEGERTIVELLENLEDSLGVLGVAYNQKGTVRLTPPRKLIDDLDSIPFPARHLLPMDKYFLAVDLGRRVSGQVFDRRWTSIFTSRGCPYRCVFCSIHLTMGRKFRARSPENVLLELQHLTKEYGIKHIIFCDDNMTFDKKRFESICDLMIDEKLDVSWTNPNGIRADTIDSNLAHKMAESGCKRVAVSPESGSQYVVSNIIKKNLNLKDLEKGVELLSRAKIIVDANFVIGLIGETKKQIWQSLKYGAKLHKLGASNIWYNIATPLYGTELHNQAMNLGFLSEDFDGEKLSSFEGVISTDEWTPTDLKNLQKLGNWLCNFSRSQKLQNLVILWSQLKFRDVFGRFKALVKIKLTDFD